MRFRASFWASSWCIWFFWRLWGEDSRILERRQGRELFQLCQDVFFNLAGDFGIFSQKFFGIFSALSKFHISKREEGTGFGEDFIFDSQLNQVSFFGNSFVVHDVKFSLLEGGSDFVFDNFDSDSGSNDFFVIACAFFNFGNSPDVQSD